jgi:hypothetical protein
MKKTISIILLAAGLGLCGWHFVPGANSGSRGGKGHIKAEMTGTPYIMPAAYKVYGDENAAKGRYYLFKLKLTNDGKGALENVTVRYKLGNIIDWTEVGSIKYMQPGQADAVVCYAQLPPQVVERLTTNKEKVEVKVSAKDLGESDEVNESFITEVRSRNDLVYTFMPVNEIVDETDMFKNAELSACFVTPEDPVVKYYTQNIQQKVMKGEAASVINSPEQGITFLAAIYVAALQQKMVYSGTTGLPDIKNGVSTIIQHIRLPREVITGKTGLCIELSFLYCSILKAAGLSPVLYFTPGHVFPGFVMNGQYYAIEATGIGGEGLGSIASPEQAIQLGTQQLQELIIKMQEGDKSYFILDINEQHQNGILPMELRDDADAKRKVDEMFYVFGE